MCSCPTIYYWVLMLRESRHFCLLFQALFYAVLYIFNCVLYLFVFIISYHWHNLFVYSTFVFLTCYINKLDLISPDFKDLNNKTTNKQTNIKKMTTWQVSLFNLMFSIKDMFLWHEAQFLFKGRNHTSLGKIQITLKAVLN